MAGLEEAFRSLPLISRWYLLLSFAVTLAASWGLINPANLYFSIEKAFGSLQVQ